MSRYKSNYRGLGARKFSPYRPAYLGSKRRRGRGGNTNSSLGGSFISRGRPVLKHQIVICIVLVVACILLKKMDIALVNRVENVLSTQLNKDYSVGEIYEAVSDNLSDIKTVPVYVANRITGISDKPRFSSPIDSDSVTAAVSEYTTVSENNQQDETHKALVITSDKEIQIFSVGDGNVEQIFTGDDGMTKTVKINHKKGIYSTCSGLDYVYVNYGDEVNRGQILGSSNQEVVRIELVVDGHTVDPSDYFDV